MLLIGSRAAKYWFPRFRKPKDWDIICSLDELVTWQKENKGLLETLIPNEQLTKFKARLKDKSSIEFELIEKRDSSKLLWGK